MLGCFLLVVCGLIFAAVPAGADTIPSQLVNPSEPEGNQACLECHSKQESMVRNGETISVHVDPAQYSSSVHGIISCTRCHAEAGPEHAKDPKKPLGLPTGRALKALKSEGCVKCHAGLYEESYDLSFHGVAVANGDYRSATCVDCHGVHDILPSRNPESRVSRQNLAGTCGTAECHPGAPDNFAEGTEHFVPADPASGGLHLLYKFFIGLILFDTMKDGPIVMFELLRRLMK
ncbi:MAG: hypothetical protein ACOY93_06240 [Bacillota bacterium]